MKDPPSADPPVGLDIRRVMVRAVVAPLVLMAIVAGWLAWQVGRLSSAAGAVERSDRVVAQVNEVQKEILDQETGLRGFLVTGDRRFLGPYEKARPGEAIGTLALLVAGDSHQAGAVSELRSEYDRWSAGSAVAVVDPAHARTPAWMESRKTEMDAVRKLVRGIVAREESVRDGRARRAEGELRFTWVGSLIVLGALGAMLSILTRSRLRHVVDTYQEALTRRAHSEAALARMVDRERDARHKAQDALRIKDEFLSTLSHELRTPLTAILGWSGVLHARKVPPETAQRALASIERNAKVQAQIVDDILDVSRIVAGKFQLRLAPVDMAAVVRSALDVVRFSAESKGVTLEAKVGPDPILLAGDPDRLQQVVWNLLSNAVKFTPRRGHVEVSVVQAASRVTLTVRDTGQGIAPEFLPHVFERFRQADSSPKRMHGGLGLGLAIVKHLVDLHGGDVHAESEGPGKGAAFTVSIPVGAVAALAEAPAESAARPVSLHGVHALVVDDDPDSLAVLATILRDRGADVELASSGAEALTLLKQRSPFDVIISDIGMPELDGYELLERIRAASPAPPALALTAYVALDDVERARAAGFQRHLAKPVTPDHLVEAVAGLVRT